MTDRRKVWDPAAFPERRGEGGGRRAHPRVRVHLDVTGSGEHSADVVVATDLSVGGAALLLPEKILAGSQARLRINLPGSDTPVVVLGVVVGEAVEQFGDWEVGVRFEEVSASDARVIEAYLDQARKDD
ncbi:MAG: PilZ domain-containing protein [Deltaproteobacteria bacterium]|nr:PilZ domain-containing protein [Deltaproteobacteria bacterium]